MLACVEIKFSQEKMLIGFNVTYKQTTVKVVCLSERKCKLSF